MISSPRVARATQAHTDISEEDLQERLTTVLRAQTSSERSALRALVPYVTNALLSKAGRMFSDQRKSSNDTTLQHSLFVCYNCD
mmetsp:Transcript_9777/g.24211  ORF Transcript_9777/g.24211 Transcript_9777/m.24211 type:complete len:84 (-) Transcript_9777:158-409(-)